MGRTCSTLCCPSDAEDGALYEPLLQENEREAVADLLQFLENRTDAVLFTGEPLRALTTLTYSSNVDLQRSAALAFAEITERHVEEVDAAVFEPLLHLLRTSNDVEVQRATSAALGNLAVNVANKIKIVHLGGLEPLIKQMSSANVEVQCNAVGCITNLATHEDNKAAIARSGALIPLTKLARTTKDIRVQRNATGALLNMTHSEENRRELVDAGAIGVLVTLLRSTDVDVVYYCTTALSNLAVDGANRRKLGQESRLVPELIELMQSASQKVQCQSALALRNLASDDAYQLEIARHPLGLARLMALITGGPLPPQLQSPSSPSQQYRQPHPQLVLAAVACIRNISIHPLNENRIIQANFLPALVALLSHENEEVQCHAISTIRNLAAGTGGETSVAGTDTSIDATSNKDRIMESGALEVIQRFIATALQQRSVANGLAADGKQASAAVAAAPLSWGVLSEMTACLAVLALSERLKPRLLKAGVVQTLIPLIAVDVPPEVQGNAAAALGNLATRVPDLEPFVQQWTAMCDYLERFLEPTSMNGTHYSEADEAAGTFQHIAVWTLLQLCENGATMRKKILERKHLVTLVENLAAGVQDEEVAQLTARVLDMLNLSSATAAWQRDGVRS